MKLPYNDINEMVSIYKNNGRVEVYNVAPYWVAKNRFENIVK